MQMIDASEKEQLKLWHLKSCPLFAALEPKELGAVFDCSRIVSVGADAVVPPPGTDEPSLWIVKRGHVKLTYVDREGHEASVLILSPGDIFGSLLDADDGQNYGEHCRTLTSACLALITRRQFNNLMQKYPNVTYCITKSNFRRIHKLQARLADMMVRPAKARLALILLDLSRQVGEDSEEGRVLSLPLSHSDLAQLIGTSREMVTHIMGRFRDSGLVSTTRTKITLRDIASLQVERDVF